MLKGEKTRRLWLVLMVLALAFGAATGGESAPRPGGGDGCTCAGAFDELVSKIEADYVAYHLAIRGKRDAEYRLNIDTARSRALHTPPEGCIFVLQDFLRFFRDGHLFLGNSPRLTAEEAERLSKIAAPIAVSESEVRRYLDLNAGRLDPVEGIWYAKEGYRVAIRRESETGRGAFIATMLSDDVVGWTPGHLKAEFRKLRDGSYNVVLYDKNHSPRYPNVYLRGQQGGAAIRRGLLLHMPPTTWGKEYPLKPEQRSLLDPIDPRRPTIRSVDESTVVVSVPSHSPEYASVLNGLVEQYRHRILRAKTLVIDIRGDEGGSAGMTQALMPFVVTKAKRSNRIGLSYKPVVVSSPDNIRYFERMQSQGWVPAGLVERMRANPGRVIRFDDRVSSPEIPAANDSPTQLPRDVAILIDGSVVSAGEAFVLDAMKNRKVTLFGENTGGVIDYQSVTIVELSVCPSLGLYLGYPTSAASDLLPVDGVNATGIPPDVRIGREVKDPIRFVLEYYARRENQ